MKSLLVRDDKLQKLDYTHCGSSQVNKKLSHKCQRCGSPSEETVCSPCQDKETKMGGSLRKSGWEQLIKTVTIRGCEVLVNGEVVRKGADYVHAGLIAKALEKQYLKHNLECLSHIPKGSFTL